MMDEPVPPPPNFRKLSLPLILISLVYILQYIVIIMLLFVKPLLSSLLESYVTFPEGSIIANQVLQLVYGAILFFSGLGTILAFRELPSGISPWKNGLPLLALLGFIGFLSILFFYPAYGTTQPNPGILILTLYLCLPCGVALLLSGIPEPGIVRIWKFSVISGVFGLAIAAAFFFLASGVLFGIYPEGIGIVAAPFIVPVLILGALQIAVVIPINGGILFQLGYQYAKMPAGKS